MPEWIHSDTPVDYEHALAFMQERVEAIAKGQADEAVWFLEHPPLYTAGTSAQPADLLWPDRFPVYQTRRGGQYTYHGPGQRVVYVMLDLNRHEKDVRRFVKNIEAWVMAALAEFNVQGQIREGRVGVWVERPDRARADDGSVVDDKIAAIGIKMRQWVSFHGISINVDPDLSHYDGIVPCGIHGHGVTSLVDLGLPVVMGDVDAALMRTYGQFFHGDKG